MAKPQVDIIDMKEYLINEYRFATKRKEQFDKNDDEVDSNYESGKMEALWDAMSFLFGVNIHEMEKIYDEEINPTYDFDPGEDPVKWPIVPGSKVELQTDIYYDDVEDWMLNNECGKEAILAEGFLIKDKEVVIPKGTVMTFKGVEKDASGWPTFIIRGKVNDYELDFAGDSFKVKPL